MSRFTRLHGFRPGLFSLAFTAAVFLAACIPLLPEDEAEDPAPPEIAYGLPVEDSAGYLHVLKVVSGGGPVTRYTVEPELAENAVLDTLTGTITYELPGEWTDWVTYSIIATGPGGADTTEIILPVAEEGPPPTPSTLVVSMGIRGTAGVSLSKPAAQALQSLVITLTSNADADTVIRDTVTASSENGALLSPSREINQTVMRSYVVKALRSWTIEVKTLDVNGVIIHHDTVVAHNILVGEVRPVTVNLSARYRSMAAKFALPDSLWSTDPNVLLVRKLPVHRVVMTINGDTVHDTTRPAYFAPMPATHTLSWDYVRADTAHVVGLYVYAEGMGSWPSSRPVYGGTTTINDPAIVRQLVLPYTGPGSPSDPDFNPLILGGGDPLSVEYGPEASVIVIVPDPNPLPKR